MNVPFVVGRVAGSWPFAVLTVTADSVRIAPRGIARLFSTDFEVPLRHIHTAFPTPTLSTAPGVGLELADGHVAYFVTWTYRRAVLDELANHGVYVTTQPRPVAPGTFLRCGLSLRPTGSSAVTLPTLPRPVVTLTLLSLFLSAAFLGAMVGQAVMLAPLILLVGGFGIARSFLVWSHSRREPPQTDAPHSGSVL